MLLIYCFAFDISIWKVIISCIPAKESTKLCYQIVEEFNSYFTSVGRLTADKLRELAEANEILITRLEVSTTYNDITSEEMF